MRIIYRFFIATLAALSILLCYQQSAFANTSPAKPSQVVSQKSDQYAPKINPHPKYFLTMQGKVDPQLVGKLNIQNISAIYHTTNTKCEYDASGGFAGAMFPRQKKISYKISFTHKKNKFTHKIPLDKLSNGACKWKIAYIEYAYSYKDTNNRTQLQPDVIIAYFGRSNNKKFKHGMHQWLCSKNQCNLVHMITLGKYIQSQLPTTKNYNFTINFKKGTL